MVYSLSSRAASHSVRLLHGLVGLCVGFGVRCCVLQSRHRVCQVSAAKGSPTASLMTHRLSSAKDETIAQWVSGVDEERMDSCDVSCSLHFRDDRLVRAKSRFLGNVAGEA
jgi:hypothetical protein